MGRERVSQCTASKEISVDPLVVASTSRHVAAVHSFKVYVATLYHSTSCTDTGSGVWRTGPCVDEFATAAVSTYATAACNGWSFSQKQVLHISKSSVHIALRRHHHNIASAPLPAHWKK